MNWPGMALGMGAVIAALAAAWALFATRARDAIQASAAAALGAALMCLGLGSGFVALVLALLGAVLVPAALLGAVALAPVAEPDVRPGGGRRVAALATALLVFAGLGKLLVGTRWPAPSGAPDLEAAWLGWRLMTGDVLLPVLFGMLLATAGLAVATLLAPRGERSARARPAEPLP